MVLIVFLILTSTFLAVMYKETIYTFASLMENSLTSMEIK